MRFGPKAVYKGSQKKKKSRRLCNSISTRFSGKSDPFVTVKQGSEGREKFRTRTIDNTLEPVWNESTVVAMPDTNGLLLLVTTYSGTPLMRSPMGQKKLTVLKDDHVNEGFFYKKMYGRFARRPKKRGRNNNMTYYRGGRKAGFHCN